jgi:hypothetical protein
LPNKEANCLSIAHGFNELWATIFVENRLDLKDILLITQLPINNMNENIKVVLSRFAGEKMTNFQNRKNHGHGQAIGQSGRWAFLLFYFWMGPHPIKYSSHKTTRLSHLNVILLKRLKKYGVSWR